MLVLIVLTTTSLIMLGMYQSLHLQTSESLARQRVAINRSLADAAFERAIALLLYDPRFIDPNYGNVEKFETPPGSGRISVLSIYPSKTVKDRIEVTLTLDVDSSQTSFTRVLSRSAIDDRRKDMRL